ncbi:MAG: hypothetical protein WAS34_18845 [Thiolinea sp.]
MNNGKEITSADFEKAFEEMRAKATNNDEAIVMLPNGSGFDIITVPATIIKAAIYYNAPKDLSKITPINNES